MAIETSDIILKMRNVCVRIFQSKKEIALSFAKALALSVIPLGQAKPSKQLGFAPSPLIPNKPNSKKEALELVKSLTAKEII